MIQILKILCWCFIVGIIGSRMPSVCHTPSVKRLNVQVSCLCCVRLLCAHCWCGCVWVERGMLWDVKCSLVSWSYLGVTATHNSLITEVRQAPTSVSVSLCAYHALSITFLPLINARGCVVGDGARMRVCECTAKITARYHALEKCGWARGFECVCAYHVGTALICDAASSLNWSACVCVAEAGVRAARAFSW